MTKKTKNANGRVERTASTKRAALNAGINDVWFESNKTRPKTVVLTLQRTTSGYTVEQATVLNRTNQYGIRPVHVSAKEIVTDINKRGIIA